MDRRNIGHLDLPEALADMHREVDWFQPADNYILEYIQRAGKTTPYVAALNIPYSASTAQHRCPTLAEHGLLVKLDDEGRGVYELSERGRQYLAGELVADDLRRY